MEVNKTVIGENAGKVWRTLENRRLSWDELVRSTGLEPAELAMAVGWLAREDKISFSSDDGKMYFEVYQKHYY